MNMEYLFFLSSLLIVVGLNYTLLKYIFPLSKVKGIVTRSVFSSMFCIGLSIFFERALLVLLPIVFVLFFFSYFYSSVFGRLSYGSVASILESNPSEAKEFYSSLDKNKLFLSIVYSGIYVFLLWYISISNISELYLFNYLVFFSLIILALSIFSLLYIYIEKVAEAKAPLKILKYNALLNSLIYFAEYFKYKKLLRNMRIESEWEAVSRKDSNTDVYVVVIGESSCRSHYHVYGYDKPTTPPLEKMKGYSIVHEAIAPAIQTMTSIPRILACNDANEINFNLNIVDLANSAGFETYWLSNQGELGHADRPIAAIANRATYKEYLQFDYTKAGSDFELIDLIKKHIKEPASKPKLFLVHTMGSHWDFRERSALGKYHLDGIESHIDCYDDTIYNSYMFLEDIRNCLLEKNLEYKICYFSDHGLSKTEEYPNLIHGAGKYFSYEAAEVPLFFIDNNQKPGRYLDRTYYLRDFVHTLGDWMSIDAKQIKLGSSVLSSENNKQEEFILDDDLNVVRRGATYEL
ncbi:sulfatase-like hydrolase/transferase [Vibrio sp. Sgm 22]|uniref:sulfatase-like hydrolase/transferase n=1 Tax=unclassified Vibrio TaxID=2614977 RepID=UPI00224982C1|nr:MULTISPECIES: sulfatase-like hydrolase/transferase [unclassified Vibrio]MCX2758240.1 sulfatase-like hydrolase/transferase [Vibrio sp. 14G-20]MCX2775400.1 sulfatase-like hydrolase/transferase [Vibrio sp. Sgm 22]